MFDPVGRREKPILVMLWSWGQGWAALGLTQLQEPILEAIPEVRRSAASCKSCLPPVSPIRARGSQCVEDAH